MLDSINQNQNTLDASWYEFFFYTPSPLQYGGGGANILDLLHLSSSVHASAIQAISPEPLNHFLPNLVWWCIMMRWCVVKKIGSLSPMIKIIWLFLLYLLNCWSICNQTWFDSTASWAGMSCGNIGLLHSRSGSQWWFKMLMNVCPDDIFWTAELNLVWWRSILSWSVKQIILFAIFKVKVTARAHMLRMWQFLPYFLLLILFLPNLLWWYIIISQSVLLRNWIAVFKVMVTAKCQWMFF